MSEEKLFTQEEVNKIVQERLAREKRKEYPETIDGKPSYKKLYFDELKRLKLLDAGLQEEQVERAAKFIDGKTEEEIEEQVNELAAEIKSAQESKQTYADPSQKRGKQVWNPFK